MVKTRRSVNGDADDRNYRKRTLSKVDDEQDETVDGWSPRELRSHYRVPRKRQHWPPQLVSKRLRTIKMPRIMYPESEDTEPEKFSRRCRPMRVFFEDGQRVRRAGRPRRSNAVDRQLRPLQPNNYMEDSDKPMQEPTSHVRRSGRQRKLLHHTFNESWITNELKVKGYPRLFGIRQMSSSSDTSSEDERARPTKQMNKRHCDPPASDEDNSNDKINAKKNANHSPRIGVKKEVKTDEERTHGLENIRENGISNVDSDKKSDVDEPQNKHENDKENSDDNSNDNDNNMSTRRVSNRNLRLRRGRSGDTTEINRQVNRGRGAKKDDIGANSHSQRETGSDSDNSSDSGSEIVVRRQLRRSNRTRKPRNAYIESQNCEGKQYTMRKKPYTIRKTYSLRERKKPKIIVRSQSPTTSSSSSSSDTEDELNVSVQNKTKVRQKSKTLGEHTDRALRDIQPVELDGSVRFSSVGGLEGHIRCLREMVLFPLMYPQLFQKFGTRPPKGVLFHGPPGTGKTLLARALASECSIQGGQKVSFFMRKGADCLKKWVGESERNIKLLFQQASKMKPSIIFFDEIDALAPVRSVRQEQVHTSVVGTLLAEMDGLCDRGEVVVIGATNRLDAVDPALRRAGRFDRELHFPPPPASQRAAIIKVITSNWNPQPSPSTVQHLAEITSGYGGSDLKALCSEAVLKALERTYPQVYSTQHALLIDTQKVEVLCEDLVRAMRGLVAAGSRCHPPPARPLFPHLAPLLSSNLESAIVSAKKLFPPAEKPLKPDAEQRIVETVNHHWSSVLLLKGDCATSHIAPALLSAIEHCAVREISLSALHQGAFLTNEQALLSIFSEVRRCAQAETGCILYAPSIDLLWPLLGETGTSLLLHQWQELSTVSNCLLLATCHCDYNQLPEQVQWLFPSYKDCVHEIKAPTSTEVTNFLKPLFLVKPLELPYVNKINKLPELPKAPPPPPSMPSALEQRRMARKEAHLLRELRIFLRDVCRKLAANRRFYKFTKPVDLEEVTDYLEIIKEPMDLETMMTKVDMHRYNCARDFLRDIDLICANALEYNPDRTSSDKQIRHEACSLRDHAHALVEVEMDSDFEEDCRAIADRRAGEGLTHDTDLPNFIFTAHSQTNGTISATSCHTLTPPAPKTTMGVSLMDTSTPQNIAEGPLPEEPSAGASSSQDISNAARKRKRKKKGSLWSKGIAKKQKTSICHKDINNPMITDEDSKENKPICTSPINGEPSPSSVDKSDTEEAQSKGNDESRSPGSRSGGRDREPRSDNSHTPAARRLQLDSTEMLFDVNTVDVPLPKPKALDSQHSPGKQTDRRSSAMLTSTPHRKKSSQGDLSSQDGEIKLKINSEDLEAGMLKSVRAVKGIGLKPLMDLYCQLDRVLAKYKAQHDRSNLPAEMVATVNKFAHFLLPK